MTNCDEIVECGRAPWLPSRYARDLEPWLADDVPTIGQFRHQGRRVLFAAADGVDGPVTAWGYLVLSDADADALDEMQFDGARAMRRYFDGLVSVSDCVELALVDASFSIIRKGEVTPRAGDTLMTAIRTFTENVLHTLRESAEAEVAVRGQLAEFEVLAPEAAKQLLTA